MCIASPGDRGYISTVQSVDYGPEDETITVVQGVYIAGPGDRGYISTVQSVDYGPEDETITVVQGVYS